MNSSTYTIHLVTGLTTNESLFLSVLLDSQNSGNPLQTVYANLIPFISRVSLNKIKKNLIAKGFITPTYSVLIDPQTLAEPLRKEIPYTIMGRPKNHT